MSRYQEGVVVCTAIGISNEYEPEYVALTMDDAVSWVYEKYTNVTLNRIGWATFVFGEGLYGGTRVSFRIRPIKIAPESIKRVIK